MSPVEREPVAPLVPAALSGLVIDDTGEPVPDAVVTWKALAISDIEDTPSWPMASWGVAERASVESVTNETGRFFFTTRPAEELAFGSVLVAVHATHFAGGLDLSAEEEAWPKAVEIILDRARPIEVEVVDADGAPVADAIVMQAGQPDTTSVPLAQTPRHQHHLLQSARTGVDGRAFLGPFRGEQALWAEKGDLVSPAWQGTRPTRCRLTLGESFTIGGTLTLPDWTEWDPVYRGERRLLVSGMDGPLSRPLARLRDVRAGEWGPLRVPLIDVPRFEVRLEGAPIVPIEQLFDPPLAGTHLRFNLVAEKQEELWFRALDPAGERILDARAQVRWGAQDDPGAGHAEGAAKPNGDIYVGTFPPGSITYHVYAPGFAAAYGELLVPVDGGVVVELKRGGRIEGRCLRGGQPVPDFELIYWKQGTSRVIQHEQCLGREDGRFVLESLLPADWSVAVATPESPSGPPLTVRVNAEETTEVVLQVGEALGGGGRIVSASDSEPIPGARVQLYSSGGLERLTRWGSGLTVGSDGTFEVVAFVPGSNYLYVEADGYAGSYVNRTLAPGEDFLDWGDIRLFRGQTLEISLTGLEATSLDPRSLFAQARVGYPLPETRFDGEGRVRFEDVPPGDHQLMVVRPDGVWTRLHLSLEPERIWSYELRLAGRHRVKLLVLDEQREPLHWTTVLLTSQDDTGIFVVRSGITEQGVVHFEGIQASQAQALVIGPGGDIVATRDLALTDDDLQTTIVLGDESLRVHVVDRDGAPVTGAWVRARSPDGNEFRTMDDSDSQGWAELSGLSGASLLDVHHGIAGLRFGIPVAASTGELEVTLDADASLELVVVDGDVPLDGVSTRIETRSGIALTNPRTTDAGGRVHYEPIDEGEYHVVLRREDAWTTSLDAAVTAGEQAVHTVQMRRLADVELTLFNAEGLPVGGQELTLRSVELGASVSDWVEAGRVKTPKGLRTDRLGVLRLEGLPRGTYSWSVSGGDQPLGGTIELAPGKNALSVHLPG